MSVPDTATFAEPLPALVRAVFDGYVVDVLGPYWKYQVVAASFGLTVPWTTAEVGRTDETLPVVAAGARPAAPAAPILTDMARATAMNATVDFAAMENLIFFMTPYPKASRRPECFDAHKRAP